MTKGDQRWLTMSKALPWIIVILLLAEVALLAWLGVSPR
jgi:hypothetical protein